MVAWYWLIVAASMGACIGISSLAFLIQGKREDRRFGAPMVNGS